MSNAFAVRVSAGRVALLGFMTAGLIASGSAVAFAEAAAPAAPAAPAVDSHWRHHHHHHHWFGGFGPYAGGRFDDHHHSYNHHHHHWYEHKLETWKGGDDTDNRGLDTRRADDNFGFACGCGDDRRRDGFRDGHEDGVHHDAVTPGDAPAAAPAAAPASTPADASATAPAGPAKMSVSPGSTPAKGATK